MILDHTQRCTTVGRTPLDERSARRRDLYLTTHDTYNRQISMPPVGFEPKISADSTCFGQFLCPSSGVFHCTHSNGICYIGLLTACEQGHQLLLTSCQETCMTYHCCVYSEKLLIMDRGTVLNMQSFSPRINLRNQCIWLVLLQGKCCVNSSPTFRDNLSVPSARFSTPRQNP